MAEEDWPEAVEQHFRRLEGVGRGDESEAEFLLHTYLRLLPDDALADVADGFRFVRRVSQGLLAALALNPVACPVHAPLACGV